MSKLKVSTREIGSVCVFDLEGIPTQDSVEDVADKIQRNIRRHRLQRVILNVQGMADVDALGMRKLMAACIRPQKSLIFGASEGIRNSLRETYVPKNVRVCESEKEVAEDFGPFLLEKDKEKEFEVDVRPEDSIGLQVERRRSKRMHVAIPVELMIKLKNGDVLASRAITTNISEGGIFTEYLDLRVGNQIDALAVEGLLVEIHIFSSANFQQEYSLQGRVNRKEMRKKQLGLAIEFLGEAKL